MELLGKNIEKFEKDLDVKALKNIPEEYFPMIDPLNDSKL